MDIDLSEDLQYYKESFVLGLTVKQAIFNRKYTISEY